MRALALALLLASCVTPHIDKATGTTLDERCAKRYSTIALWEELRRQGRLSEARAKDLELYKTAVIIMGCLPAD